MASKAVYRATAVLVIAALSGGAWWYQNKQGAGGTAAEATPAAAPAAGAGGGKPSVEVAKVEVTKLLDETQTVGSLRSRQGVMLRPEVSGRISQLNFRDGERVRKGQLLVQFDDQLQVAQVQQAQAELSIAQANAKRNDELVAQNFISRRTVDESVASLQVAQAKLALAQATAARLKIIAPFDGTVGIRLVNQGDYLKDGADIVNIEDIEAIFVDFRLPERFQTKVKRGQTAVIDMDALPGRKFTALVQAIDPLIDANGRSLGVRACIDNRRMQLRPGMFARVSTVFGQRDNARVVPEEAIVPQAGKQFVVKLIDGPDGQSKVTQRVEVKVGLRTPGKVEILEGLEPGDTIVVAGQQRVNKDGTAVRVLEVPAGGRPGGAGGPGGLGGPSAGGAGAGAGGPGSPASGGPGAAPAAAAGGSGASAQAAGPGAGKPGGGKAPPALPPLEGPDPCLAGMAGLPAAGSQPGAGGSGGGRRGSAPGARPPAASGAAPA